MQELEKELVGAGLQLAPPGNEPAAPATEFAVSRLNVTVPAGGEGFGAGASSLTIAVQVTVVLSAVDDGTQNVNTSVSRNLTVRSKKPLLLACTALPA